MDGIAATVGEALRAAREARGLTIEDVRGRLGIPAHYLQAMEGAPDSLIADELYLIPFLRRYSDFLDLDGAGMIAKFLSEGAKNEAAGVAARSIRRAQKKPVGLLVGGVVLAALLLGWLLFLGRS